MTWRDNRDREQENRRAHGPSTAAPGRAATTSSRRPPLPLGLTSVHPAACRRDRRRPPRGRAHRPAGHPRDRRRRRRARAGRRRARRREAGEATNRLQPIADLRVESPCGRAGPCSPGDGLGVRWRGARFRPALALPWPRSTGAPRVTVNSNLSSVGGAQEICSRLSLTADSYDRVLCKAGSARIRAT